MASRDARFKQAALAYLIYGIIYWAGGLYLQTQGLGPNRYVAVWFVVGAVIVLLFPYLLSRDVSWFDRWVLSRRDFARILTVLVSVRAFEVGRIALKGGPAGMPALGGGVFSTEAGVWTFFIITLATAAMLVRAAWGRTDLP